MLSACGNDKKLNYIQVSLADGEYSASIYETRDFGNTTGLNNIKIKAYYSDGSDENVELSNVQITVSFTADGSEESRVTKTFEEYTQMCEDSNLTAGFWRLTLNYKDNSFPVNIDVRKVNDNSNYTLNVTSRVGNIGKNQIYYGTKFKGIDYSVLNGNTPLDNSKVEKICILEDSTYYAYDISSLTQEEIDALPKPNEIVDSENYHVGELSNEISILENIKPGKYLIFAEIKEQENYLKSYSAYQTLVVKKSQIVATAENFKIDFTFNKYLCKGVTLDEMLHGISDGNGYSSFGNSKINGKLSLLLRSDFNKENNNLVNDNKLTNETLICHKFEESDTYEVNNEIADYGTLAEVNPQTYNFDSTKGETNTITTKVKFVPKGYENWAEKVYTESKEFEITIILHRTAYSAPILAVISDLTDFKYSTDNNGNPKEMKFDLYASDYALIPYDVTQTEFAQYLKTAFESNKVYSIHTNAKFEQDENENLYVCSSVVGSYFIRCYINPNLYYNDEITHAHRNITITKHDKTGENEGYIEYSWTISKGDIAEQSCYSANVGSIKFNADNTVELKFGENDSYKDVNFVWKAMEVGTYKDKYNNDITSNITGHFEPIEGKNSSYKKFVLTTDLTKVESTDNYYNLFIKISASDDKNWDYFEQYLLVRIEKNS